MFHGCVVAFKALAYRRGGEKVWYSQVTICDDYLRCLLDAERLFSQGVIEIPHYRRKAQKDFHRLWNGEPLDAPMRMPALDFASDVAIEVVQSESAAAGVGDDGGPAAAGAAQFVEFEDEEEDSDGSWHNALLEALGIDSNGAAVEPEAGDPAPPTPPEPHAPDAPEDLELEGPGAPEPDPPAIAVDHGEFAPPDLLDPDVARITDRPCSWAWGVARLARTCNESNGGIQASCRHHKKSDVTGCKRFFSFGDDLELKPETISETIRAAKYWLTLHEDYTRQRSLRSTTHKSHLGKGLLFDFLLYNASREHSRALRRVCDLCGGGGGYTGGTGAYQKTKMYK